MKSLYQIHFLIALVWGISLGAQQSPLYTQYNTNFSLLNPAYSGNHGLFTSSANVRSQWNNVPDGPKTQSLSTHGPLGKNVGIGFSVVNDKVYVLNESHLFADVSYTIDLNQDASLAFGIKVGGSFLNIDLVQLGLERDPLFTENINRFNPNLGTGAYYFTDRFYASFSALNVLETKHFQRNAGFVTSASEHVIFYSAMGYVFDLGKEFKLRPSLLLRSVKNTPNSWDIALSTLWKSTLELGFSHRLDNSISAMVLLQLSDQIKAGFAYDTFIQSNNSKLQEAFEFTLVFSAKNLTTKRKAPFFWNRAIEESLEENQKVESEEETVVQQLKKK